jgi:peptidoglycan hydrolase-like protein with peptidoglycan-binding domain
MPDGIAHAGGPAADVIDESNPEKITVGAKGEFVKKLQQALKDKGYYTGAVDGDFNQATGEAVKKVKTGHGLKEDMVAGAKVFAILDI